MWGELLGVAALIGIAAARETREPEPKRDPAFRPNRLFRIVTALDPPLDDFKSNFARGKRPQRAEAEDPDEYQNISTFAHADQAEQMARGMNWKLGRYLADLRIGPRTRVQVWRSNPELAATIA